MYKKAKRVISLVMLICLVLSLSGCAMFKSGVHELRGDISGNTYEIQFYTNNGEKFMSAHGEKISIENNVVEERVYNDGTWGYVETLSSVVTITIDGKQIESCGSTVLFMESGLEAEADFAEIERIESEADGFGDNTFIANIVNRYKNAFGKPTVVVIQSQLGDPICAFSGNEVYWEVCDDLPKTTKLMIDGKALYIHRANFQIIDKALLD